MEMIFVILGTVAAVAAMAYFICKTKLSAKDAEIKSLKIIMQERQESSQRKEQEIKEANEKAICELKEANDKALNVQLKAIKDQMTAETEKLLKSREEDLREGNKNTMDSILKPLKESMDKMQKAMDDNAKEHLQTTTELKGKLEQAVKDMSDKTSAVGAKADSLSEALTGRPKMQGCWGENYLGDILAREGLVNGTHYTREAANEDNSRPDFVFHFKDGLDQKDLVVDSKVSLTAFVKYMNSGPEEDKEQYLEDHIRSIKKHIDELSKKDYARKIDKSKRFADYVLMFMPIDMAYRAALDKEPMIWQEAYDKGVLIATEQTIMPFLKIIHLTWNKYQQDSNIAEITKAAEDMIERVGLFYDSYKDLGTKLRAVCKEYNSGINKLEDGGRSITTSAKKVMQIGARRAKGRELEVPQEKVFLSEGEEL